MEKLLYNYNDNEYEIDYSLFIETDDVDDLFLIDEQTDQSLKVNTLPSIIQNEIVSLVYTNLDYFSDGVDDNNADNNDWKNYHSTDDGYDID